MVLIGYHCSQEQVPPSALLRAVELAEEVGFDAAFSADHLAPWLPEQGESGSTFAWMGAALARTGLEIGAVVTPGQRYHPVVAAHAIATWAEMFPGRYVPALGSGELVNEHVTGDPWPSKRERTARLGECVEVIRRLLAGEEVTHHGRVVVDRARLWSLPATPPALFATATSEETASWAAGWADGLVTVGARRDAAAAVVDAYRSSGGAGPVALQVHVALGPTRADALALVREQWRHCVVTPPLTWDLATPAEFAERCASASDEELAEQVVIARDVAELADRLTDLAGSGADRLYLHEVSRDQGAFLRDVAPGLLAELRDRAADTGSADEEASR